MNLAPVWPCGLQIKGILLDILVSHFHWQATCSAHYKLLHSAHKKWILQGPQIECTHFEDQYSIILLIRHMVFYIMSIIPKTCFLLWEMSVMSVLEICIKDSFLMVQWQCWRKNLQCVVVCWIQIVHGNVTYSNFFHKYWKHPGHKGSSSWYHRFLEMGNVLNGEY